MKEVALTDVVFFQEGPGVRNHQFTLDGVKLMNVRNIVENKIVLDNTETHISEEEAYGKYKHFLVDEGDLIIASSGIKVDYFHKKIAFAKKEHLPLCMNTSTIRFKTLDKSKLDIDYFRYFLMTDYFARQVNYFITGSAQLNFGPSHLKQMNVLLPSIEEQKEIVSVLSKADAARQKRKQANQLTEQFLQSVFLVMFGDPVRNEKGWEVKRLEDISDRTQIGPFGTQLHEEDYIENGIPLINPKHIVDGRIEIDSKQTISKEKFETLTNYHLQIGDVIIGRRGEMGRCALVSEKENGWLCGTGSLFIRPNEKLNPSYLIFVLRQETFIRELENKAQGVTMMNLNLTIINNLDIPLPPLPLQQKFASIVKQVEQLRAKQRESEKELDNLFNSLMQRYFGNQ